MQKKQTNSEILRHNLGIHISTGVHEKRTLSSIFKILTLTTSKGPNALKLSAAVQLLFLDLVIYRKNCLVLLHKGYISYRDSFPFS